MQQQKGAWESGKEPEGTQESRRCAIWLQVHMKNAGLPAVSLRLIVDVSSVA
jgi:hypothetical protein